MKRLARHPLPAMGLALFAGSKISNSPSPPNPTLIVIIRGGHTVYTVVRNA